MTQHNKNILTVFEHDSIYLEDKLGDVVFDATLLKAMQDFYGKKGVPYYSLLNKGVKFCEYVGVIQIGNITIEVLPKANKEGSNSDWREALIGMLRSVGLFTIKAPTSTSLKVKPNSILDLYIELFIQEVEHLIHSGLIKKYRKADSNCSSLKGNILFAQHVQKNIVHQERFYTRHTVYDVQHSLHQILYKTLLLLQRINTNSALHSSIGALLLNFPEQTDIRISESVFQKISYTRKTESYRKAVEISRLLLLNYHPNVSQGRNHLLALMFDMNLLWERFVYVSLREYLRNHESDFSITAQTSKYFWKPQNGNRSTIIPDICIKKTDSGNEYCVVIDTKWKNLNGYNPSPDDLRQLYVYHEFYNANRVALVYPGSFSPIAGEYYTRHGDLGGKECYVIGIKVISNIREWKEEIGKDILNWISSGDSKKHENVMISQQ